MERRPISLAVINRSSKTQARISLDNEAVEELRALYAAGDDLPPPIRLFHDGSTYWIGDGFHRVAAATTAGCEEIMAEIEEGDEEDAFIYNCQHNRRHGVRMSNADKRNAAEMAMKLWKAQKSDREIAKLIGVGHSMVSAVRREMMAQPSPSSRNRNSKPDSFVSTVDTSPLPNAENEVLEPVTIRFAPETGERVEVVTDPIQAANAGLDEVVEALKAARETFRRVLQIKGQEVTAPYLVRFSWLGSIGQLNEMIRMCEQYRPVGGTAAKPMVVSDQQMRASVAQGA